MPEAQCLVGELGTVEATGTAGEGRLLGQRTDGVGVRVLGEHLECRTEPIARLPVVAASPQRGPGDDLGARGRPDVADAEVVVVGPIGVGNSRIPVGVVEGCGGCPFPQLCCAPLPVRRVGVRQQLSCVGILRGRPRLRAGAVGTIASADQHLDGL